MTKKTTAVITAAALAFCMTACTANTKENAKDVNNNPGGQVVTVTPGGEDTVAVTDTAVGTDKNDAADMNTENASEQNVIGVVSSAWYKQSAYINEKGEAVSIPALSSEKSPYEYIGCYKDTIFGINYIYNTSIDEGRSNLIAYDREGNRKKLLHSAEYIYHVDLYEGKVFVYDTAYSEDYSMSFPLFVYDAETFEQIDYQEEINVPEDYRVAVPNSYYKPYSGACTARLFSEAGYVLLTRNEEYYMFDGKEIVKLDVLDDVYTLNNYDKNSIIYTACGLDDYRYQLFVYDLASGKKTLVTDQLERVLGTYKNLNWFYEIVNDSYGAERYEIKVVDTNTGIIDTVLTCEKKPGHEYFIPVITDFTVIDGQIYFLDYDGDRIGWFTMKDGEVKNLNCCVKTEMWDGMCRMEAVSYNKPCSVCGKTIWKYYGEYPVIDEKLSPAYETINAYLKQAVTKEAENGGATDAEVLIGATFCSDHGKPYGMETESHILSEIRKLGSKYLAFDFSGEWYGGGAHGMPLTGHYLFDIKTGKPVEFKELFKGTESDYKEIVATKTIEYKNTLSDYENPFYTDDDKELHDSIVNMMSLDYPSCYFTDEGVVVEFQPYEIGSYASGIIEILIPYEEMGIENLTE